MRVIVSSSWSHLRLLNLIESNKVLGCTINSLWLPFPYDSAQISRLLKEIVSCLPVQSTVVVFSWLAMVNHNCLTSFLIKSTVLSFSIYSRLNQGSVNYLAMKSTRLHISVDWLWQKFLYLTKLTYLVDCPRKFLYSRLLK